MTKLVSFGEAIEALENGDAIHRYGSMDRFYFSADGGFARYTWGSLGTMIERAGLGSVVTFTADETHAADWVVVPGDKVKASLDAEIESYRKQREVAA